MGRFSAQRATSRLTLDGATKAVTAVTKNVTVNKMRLFQRSREEAQKAQKGGEEPQMRAGGQS
jgi:hypothetical protein